jgi:tight adherence protein B
MSGSFLLWLIPAVFAAGFGTLAYTLLRALREGSERYAEEQAAGTAQQLEDLLLFIPPKRIDELSQGLAVLFFVVAFLLSGNLRTLSGAGLGLLVALPAGVLGLKAPRFILRIMKQRRLQRFNDQLVDALITMSNSLRAGFSILQSFEGIVQERQSPIAEEFGMFLHKTRVGVEFEKALSEMEARVASEDLTLMVRAIETARLTGGNLTEVFEKIAETIRERVRIQGRIRALTAQGRMQAIIVGALPVLLLFAMTMLDPRMMIGFMTSKAGITLLIIGVLLEIAGVYFVRKIVKVDI